MKTLSKENLDRLNNLFTNFNVKSIFDELDFLVKQDGDGMPVALSLLEMIEENSNDFTKDVAEKGTMAEDNHTLSYKQKWALAYQVKNNLEVYLEAVKEYKVFSEEIEVTPLQDEIEVTSKDFADDVLLQENELTPQTIEDVEELLKSKFINDRCNYVSLDLKFEYKNETEKDLITERFSSVNCYQINDEDNGEIELMFRLSRGDL